jgi:hypothetical protein
MEKADRERAAQKRKERKKLSGDFLPDEGIILCWSKGMEEERILLHLYRPRFIPIKDAVESLWVC